MERVTTADLMQDLPKVVHDTQALLGPTAGEKAEEAQRRVQAALDTARTRLKAMQGRPPRWAKRPCAPLKPTSATILARGRRGGGRRTAAGPAAPRR